MGVVVLFWNGSVVVWLCYGVVVVSFTLRLPDELHASLKAEAARQGRSLHAQILWRLQGVSVEESRAVLDRARSFAPGSGLVAKLQGELAEAEEALAEREVPLGPSGREPGTPSESGNASGTSRSASAKPRTVMCEHRVPPGSFCKRCDL